MDITGGGSYGSYGPYGPYDQKHNLGPYATHVHLSPLPSPSPSSAPVDWPFPPPKPEGDTAAPATPEVRSASPEFHQLLFAQDGSRTRKRSHRSLMWWIAEILSLLLGIASITVITAVLAKADGNPPPEWPLGVTLNTFVAFFTSLTRMAFMVPIVEGLGQLKWMWFMSGKPRALLDFQTFDEASRGSWGSLKLLIRFKGAIACLGALITVSGFLTSTITQQAILYPVVASESSNGTATLERATTFSLYNGNTLVIQPQITTREKLSVVNGAFFVPNETVPHVSPICSSGECTWPRYGSIALCSEVVNLTAQGNETLLNILRNTTSTRLNFILNATLNMVDDLSSGRQGPKVPNSFPIVLGPVPHPTGAFNESVVGMVLTNQYLAYSDELIINSTVDLSKLKFLELAFFFCTKTLETEVKKGVPSTREIGSRIQPKNKSPYSMNWGWNKEIYNCYVAGTCNKTMGGLELELEPPPGLDNPETFIVDVWTGAMASSLIFATMYDSVLIDFMRGLVYSSGGGVGQAFSPVLFGSFMSTFVNPPPQEQLDGVRNITRNLAQSMSNLIRQADTRLWRDSSTAVLNGTVYTPQTFVKIHWPYIAMLASQLSLASLFLVATIAETYRVNVQVLKGSSLAVLCGLDADARGRLGGIHEFESLRERARRTKVRLERSSSGVGVWLGLWGPRPRQGTAMTTTTAATTAAAAAAAAAWHPLSPWSGGGGGGGGLESVRARSLDSDRGSSAPLR